MRVRVRVSVRVRVRVRVNVRVRVWVRVRVSRSQNRGQLMNRKRNTNSYDVKKHFVGLLRVDLQAAQVRVGLKGRFRAGKHVSEPGNAK